MDRALLERMVGAVVLVVLLVLLAPALLDGRAARDQGDLYAEAGSAGPERKTAVIVLNAPKTAPAPEVEETVVQAAIATKPAAGKPAAKPAAGSAPKSAPRQGAAPPEGYYVQVNAFADRQNADRYATEVGGAGFAVTVIRGKASSGTIYRVYSGPVDNRDSASDLAGRLADKGYQGIIVQLPGDKRG